MHAANPRSFLGAGLSQVEITTLARVYFDGCSHEEAAELENVDRVTVTRRVTRALEKLQAANVPLPRRPAARHRRRAHRPTCEPVDPALLERLRPGRAGRFTLGRTRRIVDRPRPESLAGGR